MTLNPPDEQQFWDLINGNRPRILKVCRVYSWNPPDQEDLYQEILFKSGGHCPD
jgi:RNA polymerase sigma-70 factor (ECF subfamily)